eukprot:9415135-Alexandrium_andersonii.AAC.1
MCADIYTKTYDDLTKWVHACDLINVFAPGRLTDIMKAFDTYWTKPRRENRVKGEGETTDAVPAIASDDAPIEPDPPSLLSGGVPSTAKALDKETEVAK